MSDNIISVFGTKGGIGKTTIAVCLSQSISNRSKTLLVELDSNFSVSTLLGIKKSTTIYEVLKSGNADGIYQNGNLSVLTADGRIAGIENDLQGGKVSLVPLWDLMRDYNYIIVDNHNAFSLLNTAILQKSKITVVPLTPDKLSLGAYFHTHMVLQKLNIPHRGVGNMVRRGLLGVNKEDMRIITKAREKTTMFNTLLPRRNSSSLCSDTKFMREVEKLKNEIKEVI